MSGKRQQPPRRDHNRLVEKLAEAGKTGWPPEKLASVVKHPSSARTRAPRTLRAAIGPGGSERDTLVVLRRKLAALIDSDPPAYQAVALMRQFREVDAQIRALDEAARVEAEQADDVGDDEDDPDDDSFDLSTL
ncbi:hypothetical protein MSAS_22120 [Mycobacterium saskatchewanense]|uniref:Uncharacterized protein n=1 Tax=Mycobacterium saskatchewanense TaxID=220927 RepID=A0AAJ3NQ62_9MYCO|nr:hypothetical protein [Mycobacterium saskatchewanense]ORW70668.1 hypothetical protein AWC23_16445 [Mycobacterium saskatchewanense]BBX63038.1 hypothetical protein MSAS_22120 [Mycobacterium saskatchewanense]